MSGGSSAALLSKLATQVRELRERRGWTQVQLASRIGFGVEEVQRLEQNELGDVAVARAADGSFDLVPRARRRWLNIAGSALEVLTSAEERPALAALFDARERALLLELLRSEDALDWWIGIRFATVTADPASVPALRELANAAEWSVAELTRARAAAALQTLGVPASGSSGELTLAESGGRGALAISTSSGAVSWPSNVDLSAAEEPRERPRPRFGMLDPEPLMLAGRALLRILAVLVIAVLVGYGTFLFVALVFTTSNVDLEGAGVVGVFAGCIAFLGTAIYGLFKAGALLRGAVFTWTRKRWARNRAQRLRGS